MAAAQFRDWQRKRNVVAALLGVLTLSGCLEESPVIDPPQIQGVPATEIEADASYYYKPQVVDYSNETPVFEISGKPSWARFDAESGALSGVPTAANMGESEPIVIYARLRRVLSSVGPFRIRVIARTQVPAPTAAPAPTPPAPAPAPPLTSTPPVIVVPTPPPAPRPPAPNPPAQPTPPPNAAPSIGGAPTATVVVGQAYRFQPTASDPNGDRLSFVISNMPSWASFNTSTGVLGGTPATSTVATYTNIVISVSDGSLSASLPAFTLQVQAPPNRAPLISGAPATSVSATTSYSFRPTASDPDGNALTYSIVNRPGWASFDSTTGRLNGTPTAGDVRLFAGIEISVSDGSATARLSAFSINVTQAPASNAGGPTLPSPLAGNGTLRIRATGSSGVPSSDNVGAFRMSCTFSHMAYDDPIVFPGQAGRAHLHTFFGNTGVNANSNSQTLSESGNSTCLGGIANRSGYWVPSIIDTRTNRAIAPDSVQVYYKSGYNQIPHASIQPLPFGLRMIAGNSNSQSAPRTGWEIWHDFGCRYETGSGPVMSGQSIPACREGAVVVAELNFPNCWDGVNLDSIDHRSHMAYSGGGRCPSSHPVALPTITFNVQYSVRAGDDPSSWRLASDAYPTSSPGGYTFHGDWWNGWDPTVAETWLNNCVRARIDCGSNMLGDGTVLY